MELNEIWKPAKGYEGYLCVSSLGNVKSIDRTVTVVDHNRLYQKKLYGQCRKKFINPKTGYETVGLHHNKTEYVHRLVALTFIPNPNNYEQVNHKNFIRNDNRVENLEWCSSKMNNIHSLYSGHHSTLKPVKSLTTGKTYRSAAEAARELGDWGSNVRRSCHSDGKRSVRGQKFIFIIN